jgi:hypothetical protein
MLSVKVVLPISVKLLPTLRQVLPSSAPPDFFKSGEEAGGSGIDVGGMYTKDSIRLG